MSFVSNPRYLAATAVASAARTIARTARKSRFGLPLEVAAVAVADAANQCKTRIRADERAAERAAKKVAQQRQTAEREDELHRIVDAPEVDASTTALEEEEKTRSEQRIALIDAFAKGAINSVDLSNGLDALAQRTREGIGKQRLDLIALFTSGALTADELSSRLEPLKPEAADEERREGEWLALVKKALMRSALGGLAKNDPRFAEDPLAFIDPQLTKAKAE